MNTCKRAFILGVAAVGFLASNMVAHGGNVFGCEAGMIRGKIGCALQPMQQELLTPAYRLAADRSGRAAGKAAARLLGLPPEMGTQIGAHFGRVLRGAWRTASDPTGANGYGHHCDTAYGIFGPVPSGETGTMCTVNLPGVGTLTGQITY